MSRNVAPFRPRSQSSGVSSPDLGPAHSAILVETMLQLEEENAQAEARIKEAILRAAEAGDCQRAASITRAWIDNPVAVEVAAGLEG